MCGSILHSQLERGGTCSTAKATRGHYACVHVVVGGLKLADPGITTEPRGLEKTQSRPPDFFFTVVPGRSAALDVCVASSNAAARGDAAKAAATHHTTGEKSQTCELKHRLSLPGLDSRRSPKHSSHLCSEHRVLPQRSATVSNRPPAQMEKRKPNSPRPTKSSHLTHHQEKNGVSPVSQTELPATGSEHPRSTEETTKTQTQEMTPQRQMMTMMTSPHSPANRLQTSSSHTCAPLEPSATPMDQHTLEL